MRNLVALFAGAMFGAGLFVSGMTDTDKVIGWLDFFGAWDPTLAFVMGGAILPMALAWLVTRHRKPALGGDFPARPNPVLDRRLILGAVLFGAGWGLVGLCPGPALASLSYGGWGGLDSGRDAGRHDRRTRACNPAGRQTSARLDYPMDIRQLTPRYFVAPQIDPDDLETLKAQGITHILCNRPDAEVPPSHNAATMRAAADAAGLSFEDCPLTHQTMTLAVIDENRALGADRAGVTLAYCASGTRSCIAWALGQRGEMSCDDILNTAAKAGYGLEQLRPVLEQAES